MARRWKVAAVVVAAALVAAACGGDDDDAAPAATTAAPTPGATTAPSATATTVAEEGCTTDRAGGTLTFATGSPTVGFDPTRVLSTASSGGVEITALYDTLLRYVPDTGAFEPHIAASYKQDDATTWTVKLRPDVTFGNGHPLTAAIVAANVERMKTATVQSAGLANQITSVEVVDPLTARDHLARPWGEFPYFLSEDGGMVVDTAVVAERGADGFQANPAGVGAGPYELTRFAPGEEVVMTAKDDWGRGGPLCIQTLRFVSLAGGQATVDAMRTGEVDSAFLNDPKAAAEADDAGLETFTQVSGGGNILLLNQLVSTPTSRLEVRQAIAHALDLDLINDRVYAGTALPTGAVTWKESRLYSGVPGPTYDVAEARRLVGVAKAAGWDGSVRLLCPNVPTSVELSVTVQGLLEAVGMKVTVTNVPSAELSPKVVTEKNFDLACWGLNATDAAPWATALNQYASDARGNRVAYANADMDAALGDLRAATDDTARKAALGRVQTTWNATLPTAILTAEQWFIPWTERVHGLVLTRDTIPVFDQAWVDD